jgi:chemotaxis protein MotB
MEEEEGGGARPRPHPHPEGGDVLRDAACDAALSGDLPFLRAWLGARGNGASQKMGKRTSLLHCACIGGHVDVARVVLDAGGDVNAVGANGRSPLHIAAKAGSWELCRLLLERQADPNIRDRLGRSPLQLAANRAVLDVLLHHGAAARADPREGGGVEQGKAEGQRRSSARSLRGTKRGSTGEVSHGSFSRKYDGIRAMSVDDGATVQLPRGDGGEGEALRQEVERLEGTFDLGPERTEGSLAFEESISDQNTRLHAEMFLVQGNNEESLESLKKSYQAIHVTEDMIRRLSSNKVRTKKGAREPDDRDLAVENKKLTRRLARSRKEADALAESLRIANEELSRGVRMSSADGHSGVQPTGLGHQELQDLIAQNNIVSAENSRLKADLESAISCLKELHEIGPVAGSGGLRHGIHELVRAHRALKNGNDELRLLLENERASHRTGVASLVEELQRGRTDMSRLGNEVHSLSAQLEEAQNLASLRLQKAKKGERAQEALLALQNKLRIAENAESAAEEERAAVVSERDSLLVDARHLAAECQRYRNSAKELEEELVGTKKQNGSLQMATRTLAAELSEQRREVVRLSERLQAAMAETGSVEALTDAMRAERDKSLQLEKALLEKKDEIQRTLVAHDTKKLEWKRKHVAVEKEVLRLTSALEFERARVTSLLEDRARASSLEKALSESRSSLSAAKHRIELLEHSDALSSYPAETKGDDDDLPALLVSIRSENTALRKELLDLRAQLSAAVNPPISPAVQVENEMLKKLLDEMQRKESDDLHQVRSLLAKEQAMVAYLKEESSDRNHALQDQAGELARANSLVVAANERVETLAAASLPSRREEELSEALHQSREHVAKLEGQLAALHSAVLSQAERGVVQVEVEESLEEPQAAEMARLRAELDAATEISRSESSSASLAQLRLNEALRVNEVALSLMRDYDAPSEEDCEERDAMWDEIGDCLTQMVISSDEVGARAAARGAENTIRNLAQCRSEDVARRREERQIMKSQMVELEAKASALADLEAEIAQLRQADEQRLLQIEDMRTSASELARGRETLEAQLSSVESAAQEAHFESKHRISQLDEELRGVKEEMELYMQDVDGARIRLGEAVGIIQLAADLLRTNVIAPNVVDDCDPLLSEILALSPKLANGCDEDEARCAARDMERNVRRLECVLLVQRREGIERMDQLEARAACAERIRDELIQQKQSEISHADEMQRALLEQEEKTKAALARIAESDMAMQELHLGHSDALEGLREDLSQKQQVVQDCFDRIGQLVHVTELALGLARSCSSLCGDESEYQSHFQAIELQVRAIAAVERNNSAEIKAASYEAETRIQQLAAAVAQQAEALRAIDEAEISHADELQAALKDAKRLLSQRADAMETLQLRLSDTQRDVCECQLKISENEEHIKSLEEELLGAQSLLIDRESAAEDLRGKISTQVGELISIRQRLQEVGRLSNMTLRFVRENDALTEHFVGGEKIFCEELMQLIQMLVNGEDGISASMQELDCKVQALAFDYAQRASRTQREAQMLKDKVVELESREHVLDGLLSEKKEEVERLKALKLAAEMSTVLREEEDKLASDKSEGPSASDATALQEESEKAAAGLLNLSSELQALQLKLIATEATLREEKEKSASELSQQSTELEGLQCKLVAAEAAARLHRDESCAHLLKISSLEEALQVSNSLLETLQDEVEGAQCVKQELTDKNDELLSLSTSMALLREQSDAYEDLVRSLEQQLLSKIVKVDSLQEQLKQVVVSVNDKAQSSLCAASLKAVPLSASARGAPLKSLALAEGEQLGASESRGKHLLCEVDALKVEMECLSPTGGLSSDGMRELETLRRTVANLEKAFADEQEAGQVLAAELVATNLKLESAARVDDEEEDQDHAAGASEEEVSNLMPAGQRSALMDLSREVQSLRRSNRKLKQIHSDQDARIASLGEQLSEAARRLTENTVRAVKAEEDLAAANSTVEELSQAFAGEQRAGASLAEDMAEAQVELSRTRDELDLAGKYKEDLSARLERLMASSQETEAQLADLRVENDKLRAVGKATFERARDLTMKLRHASASADEHLSDKQRLLAILEDLKKGRDSELERLLAMAEDLKMEHKSEKERLLAAIEDTKQGHSSEKERSLTMLEDLKKEHNSEKEQLLAMMEDMKKEHSSEKTRLLATLEDFKLSQSVQLSEAHHRGAELARVLESKEVALASAASSESKAADLQSRLSVAEEALALKRAEADALQRQLAQQRRGSADLAATASSLGSELAMTSSQVQSLSSEIADLRTQLARMADEKECSDKLLLTVEGELSIARGEIRDLRSELELTRSRLLIEQESSAKGRSDKEHLSALLSTAEGELALKAEELRKVGPRLHFDQGTALEASDLEARLSAKGEELAGLYLEVDSLRQNLENVNTELSSAREEISRLDGAQLLLASQVSSKSEEVRLVRAETNSFHDALDAAGAPQTSTREDAVGRLAALLADKEEATRQLTRELKAREESLGATRDRVRDVEDSNASLTEHLTETQAAVRSLQAKCESLSTELDAVRAQAVEAEASASSHLAARAEMVDQLSRSEGESARLRDVASSLTLELDSARTGASGLQNMIMALEATADEAAAKLTSATDVASSSKNLVGVLQHDLDTAKEEARVSHNMRVELSSALTRSREETTQSRNRADCLESELVSAKQQLEGAQVRETELKKQVAELEVRLCDSPQGAGEVAETALLDFEIKCAEIVHLQRCAATLQAENAQLRAKLSAFAEGPLQGESVFELSPSQEGLPLGGEGVDDLSLGDVDDRAAILARAARSSVTFGQTLRPELKGSSPPHTLDSPVENRDTTLDPITDGASSSDSHFMSPNSGDERYATDSFGVSSVYANAGEEQERENEGTEREGRWKMSLFDIVGIPLRATGQFLNRQDDYAPSRTIDRYLVVL